MLLWCWDQASPWHAAIRGGLFGLGAFGFGIYWIYISLHDYGNAPAPFAVFATFLIVLIMALYPAILGGLIGRWKLPPGSLRWLVIIPALWTLFDWIRSWLFTGFPWLALGYSQIDTPLGQLAPYLGVFGIDWAVFLSAGLLWTLLNSDRWKMRAVWSGVLVVLWLGAWALGQITWSKPTGSPLRVALVQGNISQNQKWLAHFQRETLQRYQQLSLPEQTGSDVIIWPETAIPIFYQDVQPYIAALAAGAVQNNVDYISGIPTGSWETGVFHNSVLSIGATPGFYHKNRLLPFGEYLPLRTLLLFFRDWVDIPMADFTPGDRNQPLLRAGGQPVGVSICFEAVFGSDIRLALPDATWLINVSNDAWFRDSTAPHQHLQIARMRALETSRYMARATNTGISAIINERGRITARGAQFETLVVRGNVQPHHGLTPYARFGDTPIILLTLMLLAVGFCVSRRQNSTTI